MRSAFRTLRLIQLDRSLKSFQPARAVPRPAKGWIHALRQAMGLSSADLGRRLGTSRQLPLQLERAEANDSITLRSLRKIAGAMDCELVYALVPRGGSVRATVETRARQQAQKRVLDVEHSMALEDQAVGQIDEAVEAETRHLTNEFSSR